MPQMPFMGWAPPKTGPDAIDFANVMNDVTRNNLHKQQIQQQLEQNQRLREKGRMEGRNDYIANLAMLSKRNPALVGAMADDISRMGEDVDVYISPEDIRAASQAQGVDSAALFGTMDFLADAEKNNLTSQEIRGHFSQFISKVPGASKEAVVKSKKLVDDYITRQDKRKKEAAEKKTPKYQHEQDLATALNTPEGERTDHQRTLVAQRILPGSALAPGNLPEAEQMRRREITDRRKVLNSNIDKPYTARTMPDLDVMDAWKAEKAALDVVDRGGSEEEARQAWLGVINKHPNNTDIRAKANSFMAKYYP